MWSRTHGFLNFKLLTAITLKDADAVIAQTNYMEKELQPDRPRNILVIPNEIKTERFEEIAYDGARRELEIDEDQKIILFVGRLHQVKGLEYLIEAISYVNQTEPNARLILAGDGPEKEKLERVASDLGLSNRVSFSGWVANEHIPTYMVASDVFVLPSLSEGFPNVLLEAMAAGLPIVATNVSGIPSIVDNGINGFVVEPRNPAQIAARIVSILSDRELVLRISGNNRKKAQRYSWDHVITDLEGVYLSSL